MARMWADWQPVPAESLRTFRAICPSPGYRVISPGEVPPGTLSPRLLEKCGEIVVVSSGTETGRLYFLFNLRRLEPGEGAIDEMPYGIAFDGDVPIPSGVLMQHAHYPGRTTPAPSGLWDLVLASGIRALMSEPPNVSGPLSELSMGSQRALELIVDTIESSFPDSGPRRV